MSLTCGLESHIKVLPKNAVATPFRQVEEHDKLKQAQLDASHGLLFTSSQTLVENETLEPAHDDTTLPHPVPINRTSVVSQLSSTFIDPASEVQVYLRLLQNFVGVSDTLKACVDVVSSKPTVACTLKKYAFRLISRNFYGILYSQLSIISPCSQNKRPRFQGRRPERLERSSEWEEGV
jgi:hypothetical protein